MILVDTSVWIDHLRRADHLLVERLGEGEVLGHPLVTAEIVLGSVRDRGAVARALDELPPLRPASVPEVRRLTEAHPLHGRGIGFVDAALLASCLLTPGTRLWTRDRRLDALAGELGIAAPRRGHGAGLA